MRIRKLCAIAGSVLIMTGACAEVLSAAAAKGTDASETRVAPAVQTVEKVSGLTKDETVYILTGADGATNKIIVSDHLKNTTGANQITDFSTLSGIENVKGYETFALNGNELVWNADGKDIYYQGIGNTGAPVEMKIVYRLDGKEISASALAGKSGKLSITITYNNRFTAKVEGKNGAEEVTVPFAVATGALVDNGVFQNISVSNGKVMDDGDRSAIVAVAFPGLADSLKLEQDMISIPESVEITADVTNFEFGGFYAIASNEVFSKLKPEDGNLFSELTEAVEKMGVAMTQLLDGSTALYNGLVELDSKTGELVNGIKTLEKGATDLNSGAALVDNGAESLRKGISELSAGSSQLAVGLSSLEANSAALNMGAEKIFATLLLQADGQLAAQGLALPQLTAENYAVVLEGAAQKVEMAMGKEAAGALLVLKANLDEVKGFCDGVNAYTAGVSSACAGAESVSEGAKQLSRGAEQLKSGTASLKAGTETLSNGVGTLSNGGMKMAEGIGALKEGAGSLQAGLQQFSDEAIGKLINAVDGKLGELVDRISLVTEAANSYSSYSGCAEAAGGSVKFIFKTAEIENK